MSRFHDPRQYTARGAALQWMGVRASMGSMGDGYDNATVGDFFATLDCERLDRRDLHVKAQAGLA